VSRATAIRLGGYIDFFLKPVLETEMKHPLNSWFHMLVTALNSVWVRENSYCIQGRNYFLVIWCSVWVCERESFAVWVYCMDSLPFFP